MSGIDPNQYMQQVAIGVDQINNRQEQETLLDDVEFLFEILDPMLQDQAYALIERIQTKLNTLL